MEGDILHILKKTGVVQRGHFLLSSGRHSDTYLQCARLFEHHKYSELISSKIADHFKKTNIDLVIGPAIGGILLAYEVSRLLGKRNIFAEKQDGRMVLRRGFDILPGQRVLVVEDVITTGGSVKRVIQLVEQYRGEVAGVASVVDRSNGEIDFKTELFSVVKMDVVSYTKQDCPMCKKGVPLYRPGSGANN